MLDSQLWRSHFGNFSVKCIGVGQGMVDGKGASGAGDSNTASLW